MEGELWNVFGQKVYAFRLSGSSTTLDVSELNAGVYFIRLNGEALKILVE